MFFSDIIQGCGTTKGCFVAPPNCENSPNLVCTSIFTWTAQNDGIQFFIAGTPTNYAPGENGVPVSDLYYYVAVAFSLDEFMVRNFEIYGMMRRGRNCFARIP